MDADPGVPIFCPLCEIDLPVWPDTDGRFPEVVHHPNGTHTFVWPEGGA